MDEADDDVLFNLDEPTSPKAKKILSELFTQVTGVVYNDGNSEQDAAKAEMSTKNVGLEGKAKKSIATKASPGKSAQPDKKYLNTKQGSSDKSRGIGGEPANELAKATQVAHREEHITPVDKNTIGSSVGRDILSNQNNTTNAQIKPPTSTDHKIVDDVSQTVSKVKVDSPLSRAKKSAKQMNPSRRSPMIDKASSTLNRTTTDISGHVLEETAPKTMSELLAADVLDVKALRNLIARSGLRRSQEHLRPLLWKILLGQLPADTRIWPKASVDDRAAYKNLLADVITQPVDEDGSAKSDHPLSSNDDSKWQQYLNDNKLINTIHKDIRRISSDFAFVREWSRTPPPIPIPLHTRLETHSENELSPSHFMYSPASTRDDSDKQPVATGEADALSTAVTPTKRGRGERNVVDTDTEAVRAANEEGNGQVMNRERREKHWEVVERILFVYAKTNVGVGYVQGLTDLVLPLYATMSLATDEQDHVTLPSSESSDIATTKTGNTPQSSPLAKAKHTDDEATPTATPTKMAAAVCPHAECDTFYTFTMLMGGQRNNFIHALDDTELGITGLIERVSVLLKAKDPELSMSLEDKGLLPQYYLFQWLSLLFTRQFPITGVVMVWDRLLAMDDPSDLSVYMCIAMVMNLRNVLISSEFSDAVTLLQNFHTNNPKRLIKFAFSMYLADDHGRNVRRVSGDLLERALSSRGSSAENNGNSLERSESNSSMSSSGRQSPLFGSLSFVGGSTSSTGSSTTSLKNATSSANTSVAGMMQGLSWGFTAKLTAASTKLTEVAGSAGQRLQSLATSATESYSGGSYPGSDSVQKNSRGARLQRDARANAYSRRTQPAKGGSREGAKDVHDIQSSQTKSKRSSTSHSKSNRQSGTGGDSHTWGSRRSTSKINHEISMSEMNEVSRGSGGNSQKSSGMVLGMGSMDAQGDELVDGLYGDWRRRHTSENFELAPNTEGRGYVNDTHKYHKDSGFSAETNDGVKLSFSDDDYVDFPPDLPTASLIEENVLFSFGNEDDELSGEESDVLV